MHKVVECVDKEGLKKYFGQSVTFFCMNYIYTGKLMGVSEEEALLHDAYIVFETGDFTSKDWKDAQKIPIGEHYIRLSAVESYGQVKPQ
jgi:hypothetical protein